ncbi:Palmitoyltransferase [Entamoeba marina]
MLLGPRAEKHSLLNKVYEMIFNGKVIDYLFNKPNPIFILFYCFLVMTGYLLMIIEPIPILLDEGYRLILPHVLFFCTMTLFLLCVKTPPGYITKKNYKKYLKRYAYDNVLYHNVECYTCHIPKIARSKHCKVCNKCIARYDHHCPWINQCVGEQNCKYFIGFLLSFAITMFVASYYLYIAILVFLERHHLNGPNPVIVTHSETIPVSNGLLFAILLNYMRWTCVLIIFCSVMGISVLLFFFNQLYITAKGMTTNEKVKWDNYYNGLEEYSEDDESEDDENEDDENEDDENDSNSNANNKKEDEGDTSGDDENDNNKEVENIYDQGIVTNILSALNPEKYRQSKKLHTKRVKK